MKLLIISDIHGDYYKLKDIIEKETFDELIILGDLLSYSYDDIEDEVKIMNLLYKYKDKLILIKGNCDYFVNYDMYNLYAHDIITLTFNKKTFTFTHGNTYKKGFLPEFHGDIIVTGHTHIPVLEKERGISYLNPGSISKPRGILSGTYIIVDENTAIIKNLKQEKIKEMEL